jgi:hypothetical protein
MGQGNGRQFVEPVQRGDVVEDDLVRRVLEQNWADARGERELEEIGEVVHGGFGRHGW